MNRNEYLAELKHRLRRLPKEEFDSVIMYYEEFFDDAGEENEQEAISNLGNPAVIAGQLIGEFAIKEPLDGATPSAKKSASKIWIGILAIFASPIAFPISIVLVALVFTLIFSLGLIIFSFIITGFALLVSGAIITIVGLAQISFLPYGAFFYIGGGLIMIALGILFSILSVALFRATFNGFAKLIGRVLIGRKNKKSNNNYVSEEMQ